MPVIETNTYSIWAAKQSAKGSPAASTFPAGLGRQLEVVGGDIDLNRNDGSVIFSDGNRFSSAADYILSIQGDGKPQVLGQPGVLAWLAYLFCGNEVVTGSADPYTHTATPGNSAFYSTWWKKVGRTVGPLRQMFSDSYIQSLHMECNHQKPELIITPTFVSLTPGATFSADPTKVLDTDPSLYYTQAFGTFTIDGTVFRSQSSMSITFGEGATPLYGDDVFPFDMELGVEKVSGQVTLYVDAVGLAEYYNIFYGTPTPAPGATPTRTLPANGSYTWTMTQNANRSCGFSIAGVKWMPDISIAGNPQGKAATLQLKFEARPVAGQPMFQFVTKCADPAFT